MTRPTLTRRQAGLTLIEVLVSTVVISMALVSGTWALSAASSSHALHTEDPATAASIAREAHELALALPTAPSGQLAATSASGVLALDSLDGASFSPPLLATLEAIPNSTGWRQKIEVEVYELADLGEPAVAGYAPIAAGSGRLYRLTVQVSARGADMGTWWWWLDP